MTTATRPRRTAAAIAAAALAVSLTSCTPQPNPAETAVLAYIPKLDAWDPTWCDLSWKVRTDPASCKANVQAGSKPESQLVGEPAVIRSLPADAAKADAGQIVVVRVPYKLYTPVQAYRVLQDPSTSRWLVEEYAQVHGDANDDAVVRGALT